MVSDLPIKAVAFAVLAVLAASVPRCPRSHAVAVAVAVLGHSAVVFAVAVAVAPDSNATTKNRLRHPAPCHMQQNVIHSAPTSSVVRSQFTPR